MAQDLQAKTVLVVEDDPLVRLATVETIEMLGLTAVGATSAAEAMFVLERQQIDAALVDIGLPDISGAELIALLTSQMPHVPVIVASGYSEKALRNQFRAYREIQFLHKPFRTRSLEETFRRLDLLASQAAEAG